MQTALAKEIQNTELGREADAVLHQCVHCGFCNATCPTYQLLGDELDGPRGRIYLIKQVLEGHAPGRRTQQHLDRCLTCLSCETTCPSGVRYRELLDIGRDLVAQKVPRPARERLKRWWLRRVLPHPERFAFWYRLGRLTRPLLPRTLKRVFPAREPAGAWPAARHTRRMLVLTGCVQPVLAPAINAAAARVLDRLGISLIATAGAGCCGALSHHLSAPFDALDYARRNIDAWWPAIEEGCEAIVMTASGCGVHVKDYGRLLRGDPAYAEKAKHIAELTKDLSEILTREDLSSLKPANRAAIKVAYHAPCTLQHGQGLSGAVETVLESLGFILTPVAEPHLCCGSAGTYSLLEPRLSRQLLKRKLKALQAGRPEVIATANIGCLAHLNTQSTVPVRHWIELLG